MAKRATPKQVLQARRAWARATVRARVAERKYIHELRTLASEVGEVYLRFLQKAMGQIAERGDSVSGPKRLPSANVKRDVGMLRVTLEPQIKARVQSAAERMHNATESASKAYAEAVGIMPVDISRKLAKEYDRIVRENVSYVVDAQREYAAGVVEIFTDPGIFGRRVEDLAEELRERTGVAESRAELIARDQTLKTLGKLNESRQRAAGVTQYIWCTSGDQAVRPEHADREGRIFTWDDPPEGGNPGEDFQCRCSATPVIDEFEGLF